MGQTTYDKSDQEHNEKGNKITRIAYGKGVVGRNEKEIKGSYTEKSRKQGRTTAYSSCSYNDTNEIDHGKINNFKIGLHKEGKTCASPDDTKAEQPLLYFGSGAPGFRNDALYRFPGITGYDVHLNVPAPPHELIEHRPEQFIFPSRMS